jgi:hypothetical protein
VAKDPNEIKDWETFHRDICQEDTDLMIRAVVDITVTEEKPDLTITDIWWDNENPTIGDELTFSYTVKNQGVVDTPSEFNNLLYIDGELWDLSARGSLAAGESKDRFFTHTWKATAGDHTIKVVADGFGEIDESDETNNASIKRLIVEASATAARAPEEEWNRTFGGSDNDYAYSVQQTTDGGYILAGFTSSYGAGSTDFWLIKTNSAGNEEWNRTFGGSSIDMAESVQQTKDGGYILAGTTCSYGAGSNDFWLVKTDSAGNEEWNRTYGESYDGACSVQQTTDDGYILAGLTASYDAGSEDFWLVKTDSAGNEEWSRTFGGDGCERAGGSVWAGSVQQTTDGGYILAGTTCSYGAGFADFWLVKTNSAGNEEWNRTFGGSSIDVAWSVQQTTDGGYILAGLTSSYGAGSRDFWLVKTDSAGNEEWNRTFGGSSIDVASSVQQTTDDGYILAGATISYGAGSADFWLVKTDSAGTEDWSRTCGGSGDDKA